MADIILILGVSFIFLLCFFLMSKLDIFIDENRRKIEQEESFVKPSKILISAQLPDSIILKEIHQCRKDFRDAKILLYDADPEDSIK